MKPSRVLHHAFLSAALATGLFAAEGELAALRAKAEKGNAIAQYNLGLAYAEGRDTPVDRVEACVWLTLARENGTTGRALELLLPQLSAAELDAAKARLAERRAAAGRPPAPDATPGATASPGTGALERELAQARTDKQQLSNELAAAWKEADQLKAELEKTRTTASSAADTEQLRRERDSLSNKLTELAGEIAALRTDRDRLQTLAAQTQKDAATAKAVGQTYQDQARASELRIGELVRQTEQLKAELSRAQQSIAALKTPSPAASVENAELLRKSRELEAALADLENARNANLQLSASLAKASEDRAGLEKMVAQAQNAALTAQAESQKSATPAYPDLRERVADLEAQITALRNAPPAYPDLRDQVAQLQNQLAATSNQTATPGYPDLRERVSALEQQLVEANRRADSLDARATALANDKTGLENDLSTLRAQLTRSQQHAGAAQDEADNLRAQNRTLQEQVVAAAKAAPAYPDLRERVSELEQKLATAQARPTTPDYPDLRSRVQELETQLAASTARPAAPSYPDLRERVGELEAQLAALRNAPPAYPDLRGRVADLERQLASAGTRTATPAYPDLSGRVSQLESALATARAELAAAQRQQTPGATEDNEDLKQKLATAEDKLATALSGYSQLQKEFDALQAASAKSASELGTEKETLASRLAAAEDTARTAQAEVARLNDALAATQRGSSQAGVELASTRALLQQLQGTNALLAQENYQLKAALAGNPAARSAATTAAAANVRTHTVAEGDSLSKISQRYYGTPSRWQEIYAANRDTVGPQGQLRVGMVLRIP